MRYICLVFIICHACFAESFNFQTNPSAIYRKIVNADWRGIKELSLDIKLLATDTEDQLLATFFIESKNNMYFESAKHIVLKGQHSFKLDLTNSKRDWVTRKARRMLAPDALRWVRCWGIKIYSQNTTTGVLSIEKLNLLKAAKTKLAITAIKHPRTLYVGEINPIRIYLNKHTYNPYEQTGTMSWNENRKPLYYQQDYWRLKTPQQLIELQAFGKASWVGHYIPKKAGSEKLTFILRINGELVKKTIELTAVKGQMPSKHKEQISFQLENKRRLFKWDKEKGRWQFPEKSLNTEKYWRAQLDWTSKWGAYTGMGEFEQKIAWQLEAQIRSADKSKSYPFVIFSQDELDNQGTFNWKDHPYLLDGSLKEPADYFSSEKSIKLLVNRAYYVWSRYNDYPQMAGIVLDIQNNKQSTVEWLNKVAKKIAARCPGLSIYTNCAAAPTRPLIQDMDYFAHWKKDRRLAHHTIIDKLLREREVKLEGRYPGKTAMVYSKQGQHWGKGNVFSVDIKTSEAAGDEVKVQCIIRTDRFEVYESKLIWLRGNDWNRVFFNLFDKDLWTNWTDPKRKISASQLLNIKELALRFYCDYPNEVILNIKNSRLLGQYDIDAEKKGPIAISKLTGNIKTVNQFEKFELDFKLNREFRNPYDAEEIDVHIELVDPDGMTLQHPGFYYQGCKTYKKDKHQLVEEIGEPSWKIRFTPTKVGDYAWAVYAKSKDGLTEVSGEFTCKKTSSPGFIRIAKKDATLFEDSQGKFFYPIGHNLRSPSDRRRNIYLRSGKALPNCDWAESAGTEAFAVWFAKMNRVGENFTRIWMSPWWL
ncbi:MAG: DUF5060 domain-containing protein, partial [Lentisphaeria bacterium]|nr:DUF5060 domain-containing protein [Lentisphaeria bacterium]